MCSAHDDPTTYDPPTPTRPRTYVLSGDTPEPRGSVALAVIGEMLTEAEAIATSVPQSLAFHVEVETLRRARDRIAAAEQAVRA